MLEAFTKHNSICMSENYCVCKLEGMSELTPQCSPAATGTKAGVLGCFDNDAIGRI